MPMPNVEMVGKVAEPKLTEEMVVKTPMPEPHSHARRLKKMTQKKYNKKTIVKKTRELKRIEEPTTQGETLMESPKATNPEDVDTVRESSDDFLTLTKVVEAILIDDKENVPGSPPHCSPIIMPASPNGMDDKIQREKESSAKEILNPENAEINNDQGGSRRVNESLYCFLPIMPLLRAQL